jgi:hypothetical protein
MYISRLQVLGQNSLTLTMKAETSVAIASGHNVTSNKTLFFNLGIITVTRDLDVKKGKFVQQHVRQFTVSDYEFHIFMRCYCSIKPHLYLFWRQELLNGPFTVARVFKISFLHERSFSFLFIYKTTFANLLTNDLL